MKGYPYPLDFSQFLKKKMDFDYLRVPKREFGSTLSGFGDEMSVDLGDLEQFEDNVRKKFHTGLKARMYNEYMWGGSLRNLVVNQSFIRVS